MQVGGVYLGDGTTCVERPGNGDDECPSAPPGDIPTVSEWGIAIMALLLIGGKVYFSRRRAMRA